MDHEVERDQGIPLMRVPFVEALGEIDFEEVEARFKVPLTLWHQGLKVLPECLVLSLIVKKRLEV